MNSSIWYFAWQKGKLLDIVYIAVGSFTGEELSEYAWNHLAVAGPAGVLRRPFVNLKAMHMKQHYVSVHRHCWLYQKGKGNEWLCARVLKATTGTTVINQSTSAGDDNITCMWLIDMSRFAFVASIHNGRTYNAGSWRAKDSMINNPLEYLINQS